MAWNAVNDVWNPAVYLCCGGATVSGESVQVWENAICQLNHKGEEAVQAQTTEQQAPSFQNNEDSDAIQIVRLLKFLMKVHIGRWRIQFQIKKDTTGQFPHWYDGAGTAQAQAIDEEDPGGGDDPV